MLLAHPRGEVLIWSNPSEATTSNYTEPEVREEVEVVVSRKRVSPMPFEEARAMVSG